MNSTTSPTAIVTVDGPIPVTAESGMPFGGAGSPIGLADPTVPELLAAHGFVEEEFFVSGTVAGQPYTTSLLVRRPADASAFSGLVVLEPVHMQGALGLWLTCHPAILSGGHAWITLGSQLGAVEGPIKMANPSRYARLNVPSAPTNEDPLAELESWSQSESPTVPQELFAIDTISNEIMAQVGTLLKSGDNGRVLPGFAVKYLVMGGASQTGGATLNFIRAAHPGARLPDGKPVYDGFLPMAATGWAPVSGGGSPVMHTFAEGDLVLFGVIGPDGNVAARPDSDAPDDRYRCYQITGASHLPTRGLRDARSIPQLGLTLEPHERLTQFPSAPFSHAAFVHLVDWITQGIAPPHAAPIEIAAGAIVRDELGNARGGVRSPYVDVPTASYFGARYVRNLIGVEEPLAPELLQKLYGTRANYLALFDKGIDQAVSEGWLVAADGEKLKQEEAESAPL